MRNPQGSTDLLLRTHRNSQGWFTLKTGPGQLVPAGVEHHQREVIKAPGNWAHISPDWLGKKGARGAKPVAVRRVALECGSDASFVSGVLPPLSATEFSVCVEQAVYLHMAKIAFDLRLPRASGLPRGRIEFGGSIARVKTSHASSNCRCLATAKMFRPVAFLCPPPPPPSMTPPR